MATGSTTITGMTASERGARATGPRVFTAVTRAVISAASAYRMLSGLRALSRTIRPVTGMA